MWCPECQMHMHSQGCPISRREFSLIGSRSCRPSCIIIEQVRSKATTMLSRSRDRECRIASAGSTSRHVCIVDMWLGMQLSCCHGTRHLISSGTPLTKLLLCSYLFRYTDAQTDTGLAAPSVSSEFGDAMIPETTTKDP